MKRILLAVLIQLFVVINCVAQEVSLPDSIINKIVIELTQKDHLSFVIDQQIEVLKVYAHSDSLQKEEIKSYKVELKNDKLIIADLNVKVKLTEKEVEKLKKELVQQKLRKVAAFFKGLGVGILMTLLFNLAK